MENRESSIRLWTITDVSEYLQVKPTAIRRWIYERRIRFYKIGRLVRFNPNDLIEDIQKNKIGKI